MQFSDKYTLIRTEEIPEVGAAAYVLRHKKSQAHLILLETQDDNKVFDIAFRTPPENDKGIPHILEHSVLCGSEKYPAKDPFVELVKGSLNTFLNAMTFPEKTMYPVGSTNQQDFKNLMSVYLDAVFHPNIYRNEKIFLQEGWHYELEAPDSELRINGVVYNEMRGAFSDPDDVLERFTKATLFPDTPYGCESGGDPKAIPELSYEEFLNFHKKYYHPSNSYIYLYGDMDFTERLEFLDREYLSCYDAIDPASEIPLQEPFSEMKEAHLYYGITEEEESEVSIFSWNKVVGGMMDPVRYLAYEVLSYALLSAPGAPIERAILEAGLGTEIYGGYNTGYRQPVFSVNVKGGSSERFSEFSALVEQAIRDAVNKGISKKTLSAGIHNIEFSLREADYGRYPKGLMYGMQIYDTWIFDEDAAFIHLKYNDTFRKLKELAETDFFEKLALDLLSCTHGARILLEPKRGLISEQDRKLAEKLQAYRASLNEEEIQKLIRDTEELKAYQAEPSSEEDLLRIPLLEISDIQPDCEDFINEAGEAAGVPVVRHTVMTSGISYAEFRFSMKCVDPKDYPAAALLKNLYTMMDTEHMSYQELNDEISLYTGGLGCEINTYINHNDGGRICADFAFSGKMLYENSDDLMNLLNEILHRTVFENAGRMKEIIQEIRSQMQSSLVAAGHSTAVRRVLSYSSAYAACDDSLSGLTFYRYLEDLEKHFDERKEELFETLKRLQKEIFAKENLVISYTGEEEGYAAFSAALPAVLDTLTEESSSTPAAGFTVSGVKDEGFETSSQVQYVAMGGNFRNEGYEYHGAMKVLRTILGYDYLWTNIRVKGGAYGCMSMFSRDGEAAFVSYRDPNLRETREVFLGMPAYLRELQISDRDMTKYIIGTISELDTPLTPSGKGKRSMAAYLSGITHEMILKERKEVLNCTPETLREMADPIEAVLRKNRICVVGSEAKISECRDLFTVTENL